MRVRVLRSIRELDETTWDAVCRETVFSHGWFRALEESRAVDVEPRHLILEDEGRVVGILPCVIQRGDPYYTVAERLFGPMAGWLARAGLRGLPALLAYSPLANRTALFLAPGVDVADAVRVCQSAMDRLCREERLPMSGWLFVDGRDTALTAALGQAGYAEAFLCPAATWVNGVPTFEAYLEQLKRAGRHHYKMVRHELNQAERSPLRVEEHPMSAVEDETLARMHRNHSERRSPGRAAALPAVFFASLKRHLNGRAFIHTASLDEALVSYSVVLKGRDRWHMFLCGEVDARAAREAKQHFHLNYYFPIRLAIAARAPQLDYGLSTYEAKVERGCRLSSVRMFLRPAQPALAWLPVWLRVVDRWYRWKYRRFPCDDRGPSLAPPRGPWWQRWLDVVFEWRTFVVISFAAEGPWPQTPAPDGLEIRLLQPHEMPLLRPTTTPSRWALFRRYQARGYRCYSAWLGQRLAGYWWITTGRMHRGRFFPAISLRPDETYSGYLYVDPRCRGQQVALALRRHAVAELVREGVRVIYSGVLDTNLASLKSAARSGGLPRRLWLYRKIGPVVWRRSVPVPDGHPVRKLFIAERQRSNLRPFHAEAAGNSDFGWRRPAASLGTPDAPTLWTPHDPLWVQAWRAWRAYGWRRIWHETSHRLAGFVGERAVLVEFVGSIGPERVFVSPRLSYESKIRELAAAELPLLRPVTSQRMFTLFGRFAQQGYRCFAAFVGGRLVSYNWYTHHPYRSAFTRITHTLEPGAVFLVYSHTIREWRGRGIDCVLKARTFTLLQQEGVRAVRTVIEDTNRSSIRISERFGFVPVLRYHYRRWLGWRRVSREPVAAAAADASDAPRSRRARLYASAAQGARG
jgi:predicted N-acyltransferase/L-amino acid N-acyltransferase YncA